MIFERVLKMAPSGTVIPKPAAKQPFKVKGVGTRRGEPALIYYVPNHKNPKKPNQKGINISEIETAYKQLVSNGTFTREWFRNNMPACNAEGGCNFTTIGGFFILLGEAEYIGNGEYRRLGGLPKVGF